MRQSNLTAIEDFLSRKKKRTTSEERNILFNFWVINISRRYAGFLTMCHRKERYMIYNFSQAKLSWSLSTKLRRDSEKEFPGHGAETFRSSGDQCEVIKRENSKPFVNVEEDFIELLTLLLRAVLRQQQTRQRITISGVSQSRRRSDHILWIIGVPHSFIILSRPTKLESYASSSLQIFCSLNLLPVRLLDPTWRATTNKRKSLLKISPRQKARTSLDSIPIVNRIKADCLRTREAIESVSVLWFSFAVWGQRLVCAINCPDS